MQDLSGITTLLGSLGTSNTTGSFDLSTYASIKNGSYGKLMKAYYGQDKSSSSGTSSTSKKSSTADTDTTGLSKMKSTADELKSAADTLTDSEIWKDSSLTADSDKIKNAVKNFVDSYNNVIDQAGKVDSDNVESSVKWMTSLTDVMQKSLNKIGISVGTDNKMTLDEDALASADMSSLKTLFRGTTSYGSEIAQKASNISSASVNTTGLYTSDATVTSTLQSMFSTEV